MFKSKSKSRSFDPGKSQGQNLEGHSQSKGGRDRTGSASSSGTGRDEQEQLEMTLVMPGGKMATVTTDSRAPMLDVLVQACAANQLSPAEHLIRAVDPDGADVVFQPSQSVGSLGVKRLYVVSKKSQKEIKAKQIQRQQSTSSFEMTIRMTVHFSGGQRALVRVSPAVPLMDIYRRLCSDKQLDMSRYEVRLTSSPETTVDMSRSLEDYQTNEISLIQCQVPDRYQSMADLSSSSNPNVTFGTRGLDLADGGGKAGNVKKKKGGFFSFLKKDKKSKLRKAQSQFFLNYDSTDEANVVPAHWLNGGVDSPSTADSRAAAINDLDRINGAPSSAQTGPGGKMVTVATGSGTTVAPLAVRENSGPRPQAEVKPQIHQPHDVLSAEPPDSPTPIITEVRGDKEGKSRNKASRNPSRKKYPAPRPPSAPGTPRPGAAMSPISEETPGKNVATDGSELNHRESVTSLSEQSVKAQAVVGSTVVGSMSGDSVPEADHSKPPLSGTNSDAKERKRKEKAARRLTIEPVANLKLTAAAGLSASMSELHRQTSSDGEAGFRKKKRQAPRPPSFLGDIPTSVLTEPTLPHFSPPPPPAETPPPENPTEPPHTTDLSKAVSRESGQSVASHPDGSDVSFSDADRSSAVSEGGMVARSESRASQCSETSITTIDEVGLSFEHTIAVGEAMLQEYYSDRAATDPGVADGIISLVALENDTDVATMTPKHATDDDDVDISDADSIVPDGTNYSVANGNSADSHEYPTEIDAIDAVVDSKAAADRNDTKKSDISTPLAYDYKVDSVPTPFKADVTPFDFSTDNFSTDDNKDGNAIHGSPVAQSVTSSPLKSPSSSPASSTIPISAIYERRRSHDSTKSDSTLPESDTTDFSRAQSSSLQSDEEVITDGADEPPSDGASITPSNSTVGTSENEQNNNKPTLSVGKRLQDDETDIATNNESQNGFPENPVVIRSSIDPEKAMNISTVTSAVAQTETRGLFVEARGQEVQALYGGEGSVRGHHGLVKSRRSFLFEEDFTGAKSDGGEQQRSSTTERTFTDPLSSARPRTIYSLLRTPAKVSSDSPKRRSEDEDGSDEYERITLPAVSASRAIRKNDDAVLGSASLKTVLPVQKKVVPKKLTPPPVAVKPKPSILRNSKFETDTQATTLPTATKPIPIKDTPPKKDTIPVKVITPTSDRARKTMSLYSVLSKASPSLSAPLSNTLAAKGDSMTPPRKVSDGLVAPSGNDVKISPVPAVGKTALSSSSTASSAASSPASSKGADLQRQYDQLQKQMSAWKNRLRENEKVLEQNTAYGSSPSLTNGSVSSAKLPLKPVDASASKETKPVVNGTDNGVVVRVRPGGTEPVKRQTVAGGEYLQGGLKKSNWSGLKDKYKDDPRFRQEYTPRESLLDAIRGQGGQPRKRPQSLSEAPLIEANGDSKTRSSIPSPPSSGDTPTRTGSDKGPTGTPVTTGAGDKGKRSISDPFPDSKNTNGEGKKSTKPPVVMELDTREELMLAIRINGGVNSLRKVSVAEANWS